MSKVLITGYKTYSFENKESGEVIEGIKVSFLGNQRAKSTNEHGYLPLQTSLNLECLPMFKEVPGIYEASTEMVPGKGNKPTLAVTGFEFIKGLDFNALYK